MDIVSVRPDALDASTADELAATYNRALEVDAPHLPRDTGEIHRLRLVNGFDGEPTDRVLLARDGHGRLLGYTEVELPTQENLNLIWFDIVVEPDARRQGVGSALLDAVVAVSAEVGRDLLMAGTWHGSAGVTFLKQHAFEQGSVAAQRRLDPHLLPREGDAELLERAQSASAGYETLRVAGPMPDALRESMLTTVQAINDAPLDDLELEDDNITVDRLRRYDAAQEAQHARLYRVLAQHCSDGAFAGHTAVAVDGLRPFHGEQHDTTVRREHRGHRLGLRLKLEMLDWLRAEEPQVHEIDTWNQESNTHMIAVNDAIGCTVVGREVIFQKHV